MSQNFYSFYHNGSFIEVRGDDLCVIADLFRIYANTGIGEFNDGQMVFSCDVNLVAGLSVNGRRCDLEEFRIVD